MYSIRDILSFCFHSLVYAIRFECSKHTFCIQSYFFFVSRLRVDFISVLCISVDSSLSIPGPEYCVCVCVFAESNTHAYKRTIRIGGCVISLWVHRCSVAFRLYPRLVRCAATLVDRRFFPSSALYVRWTYWEYCISLPVVIAYCSTFGFISSQLWRVFFG